MEVAESAAGLLLNLNKVGKAQSVGHNFIETLIVKIHQKKELRKRD